MAYLCCLAGITPQAIPLIESVLRFVVGADVATVSGLDVSEGGRIAPDLLVCDVDRADVDQLELIRQIRLVLPECLIAVYSNVTLRMWGRACFLAGANCLLSKDADGAALAVKIQDAIRGGRSMAPPFSPA